MAIDAADLNAGLIDQDQARTRRQEVTKEAVLRFDGWCVKIC